MTRIGPRRTIALIAALTIAGAMSAFVPGPVVATELAQSVVVSANPAGGTPNVQNGRVNSLAQVDDRIFAGGTFTTVRNTTSNGGQTYTRNRVFALDADTFVVDTEFVANVDGDIEAVAASPDGDVFIAGNFRNVNGAPRRGFAKLDADTGELVPGFTTVANGRVRTMVVHGNTVYLGGNFTRLGGILRDRLGAVDALTGAVSTQLNLPVTQSYSAGTGRNVWKLDVSPAGDRLAIVGNFRVVGGQTRVQVAMIDLTTSPDTVLANWNTNDWDAGTCATVFNEYPRDVQFSPDGSYFAIVSTGAGYWPQTLCDTLTRWPTYATGADIAPDWIQYPGGDTLFSVGITGSTIYVGGHQRWMNNGPVGDVAVAGAVERSGISAHDPLNGTPYDWNPGRDPRGLGVFDFLATPDGLWFGSNTQRVAGEIHARLAFFPVEGGHVPAVGQAASLPADLYSAGVANSLTERAGFDGAAPVPAGSAVNTPGVDWTQSRGAFYVNGSVYAGWTDGRLYGRTFDGNTLGPQRDLLAENGYVLGPSWISFANVSGMYWEAGRLYYTRQGDARLFYRYFSPDSELIDSVQHVASGDGDGFNWSAVRGVTYADGAIFYAEANGDLHRVNANSLGDPIAGTDVVIAGPGVDGVNYATNGMFMID